MLELNNDNLIFLKEILDINENILIVEQDNNIYFEEYVKNNPNKSVAYLGKLNENFRIELYKNESNMVITLNTTKYDVNSIIDVINK